MAKNRQSNPFAAMTIIVLIAILFMGYWVAVPIYSALSETFHDNTDLEIYTSESVCMSAGHYWVTDDGPAYCSQLPTVAKNTIFRQRRAWLIAPFIFAVSLIIWYITKSTSRDMQRWQQ
jgi:hypothetical protein